MVQQIWLQNDLENRKYITFLTLKLFYLREDLMDPETHRRRSTSYERPF